jgi:hypothetical protein
MQDFLNMLRCHELTLEQAKNLEQLKPYQREHVRHSQSYALAQAERRKRERELNSEPMTQEEWDEALDSLL